MASVSNTNDIKIILIPLTKFIILYMRFSIIKIWKPSFQLILLRDLLYLACLRLNKQIYI